MDMTIEQLKHKIKRAKKQLESYNIKEIEKYTAHGGREIGYLQGKISVYEDWLDDLEDNKKQIIEDKDKHFMAIATAWGHTGTDRYLRDMGEGLYNGYTLGRDYSESAKDFPKMKELCDQLSSEDIKEAKDRFLQNLNSLIDFAKNDPILFAKFKQENKEFFTELKNLVEINEPLVKVKDEKKYRVMREVLNGDHTVVKSELSQSDAKTLANRLNSNGDLYTFHSVEEDQPAFENNEGKIDKIIDEMDQLNIEVILHPKDLQNKISKEYEEATDHEV